MTKEQILQQLVITLTNLDSVKCSNKLKADIIVNELEKLGVSFDKTKYRLNFVKPKENKYARV